MTVLALSASVWAAEPSDPAAARAQLQVGYDLKEKGRTNILFDYDSAKLMARDELELRLAVDRRLFTNGDGVAGASGFASPEGRSDYNTRLSLARAAAIIQAVRDAFGETLALTKIRGLGFGEDAALRAGLLNPPGKSEGERQRILREAAAEWPNWRKVELRVQGVLVARVMGRGAGGPP